MALRGTLGDFSLADILQLIGLQRKSGVLYLRREGENVLLGFDNGRIVSAESSGRPIEHRVGNLLVRIGKLTEARLDQALKVQKQTLKRLGHVVVENGWVDADSIRHQLLLQITETVFELFRWKHGEYDFQPDHPVDWDREFIEPIPCDHLMMEGARIVDEWPMIERVIPSRDLVLKPTAAGAEAVASVADSSEAQGSIYEQDIDFGLLPADPMAEKKSDRPVLGETERHVLRWVDGQRSCGEIADLTELGTFEGCKVLAHLVQLKLVEPTETAKGVVRTSKFPRLFQSALPAKAFAAVVIGLAIIGTLTTGQQLVKLVSRDSPTLDALPRTFTPAAYVERATGLDRMAAATGEGRIQRVARAVQVYRLHRGAWPDSVGDLVDAGILERGETRDPWGRSYVLERHAWGSMLYESGARPDGSPASWVRVVGHDPAEDLDSIARSY